MKKIDYVIISSDENPMYRDFYEVVAKRWLDLGFKTYYMYITDKDEITENQYGIVHKVKALDFVSTGFQSQVIRLFASKYIDGYILTSDIDMLPINGDYYNQYKDEVSDDNVIVFSGQPYGNVPYYPMCYILSHSSNFVKYLSIEDVSFENYCKYLLYKYGEAWNTDENFMYEKFESIRDKLIIKNRDFRTRIDRGNWWYDENGIKSGYYIDSHLLRPYKQYKENIDSLIKSINSDEKLC